jgi:repressor LexA
MSQRQEDILNFIVKHNEENGYSPTHREIALAVGLLSSSTVHGHVERLVKKGLLINQSGSPRTIKAVNQANHGDVVKELEFIEDIPDVIEWKNKRYKLIQQ